MINISSDTLSEDFRLWLDRFLLYLRQEKRHSVHTLSSYEHDIIVFGKFLVAQGVTCWTKIDVHHVRKYITFRHHSGMSGRSIQRELSSIRSIFRFLLTEDIVLHNPAEGIRAPQSEKYLPPSLDVDEVNRLLAASPDSPLIKRDFAMMELAYSSGLRVAELVGLDVIDIDFKAEQVRVWGKGGKSRDVPVGRIACSALRVWLSARAEIVVSSESALFVNRFGRRLTARAVQQRMRYWAIQQGLNQPLHPHMLRHSFASHVLQSSSNLRAVQELLGHANISTTQVYTKLDYQYLAQVYDRAHPRAKKKP